MFPFGPPNIEKLKTNKKINKLIKIATAEKGNHNAEAAVALVDIGLPAIEPLLSINESLGPKGFIVVDIITAIGEQAVELLLNVLEKDHGLARFLAVDALGRIGDSRANKAVLKAIDDDDYFVSGRAMRAAGNLVGSDAQESILQYLKTNNDYVHRKMTEIFVISTLGEIGNNNAVHALKKIIKKNPEPETATRAATALGKIQKRIGKEQSSLASSTPESSSGDYEGGFGEPYCSKECHDKGGEYISAVMLKKQSGVCGYCESPVDASMYGESNCAVIPYESVNLFICNNCTGKARDHLNNYTKCCMCEKQL